MLNRSHIQTSYPGDGFNELVGRIKFIKDMINSNQNKRQKSSFDAKRTRTQLEDEFTPRKNKSTKIEQRRNRQRMYSFQINQSYFSSNPNLEIKRSTRNSTKFIDNIENENENKAKLKISLTASKKSERLPLPPALLLVKQENIPLKQQSKNILSNDSGTARLREQELKVARTMIQRQTSEITQQNALIREKDLIIQRLEDQLSSQQLELNKLNRERDDLKDQLYYAQKKINMVEDEQKIIKQREQEIRDDLEKARLTVQQVKAFEQELIDREKNMLKDWQILEKDKFQLKEKQSKLLIADQGLQSQLNSIQALRNRIALQEKRNEEVHLQKMVEIENRLKTLEDLENQLRMKEAQIQLKYEECQEIEQKIESLQMNENLWIKKFQSELKTIETMKQKNKF